MSQPPPYVQLAQLENKLLRGILSRVDYLTSKWQIVQEVYKNKEIADPIWKDNRKREIRDAQRTLFRYIPPSVFVYGENGACAELKAAIYMSKYPVTVQQFLLFLEQTGWDYPEEDLVVMRRVSPTPDCPVTYVSWLDAKEYCRWVRRETDEYYSLPYEVEWEYSARGIDGRPYPWGYKKPDNKLACFSTDNGVFRNTVPVGSYLNNTSPFGCMDMVGNVWEFCLDDFDDKNEPHSLRGGAWCHGGEYANCTARVFTYPPDKRIEYGGFRMTYLPGEMFEEYQSAMLADS